MPAGSSRHQRQTIYWNELIFKMSDQLCFQCARVIVVLLITVLIDPEELIAKVFLDPAIWIKKLKS